jgi:hypothetical protein
MSLLVALLAISFAFAPAEEPQGRTQNATTLTKKRLKYDAPAEAVNKRLQNIHPAPDHSDEEAGIAALPGSVRTPNEVALSIPSQNLDDESRCESLGRMASSKLEPSRSPEHALEA